MAWRVQSSNKDAELGGRRVGMAPGAKIEEDTGGQEGTKLRVASMESADELGGVPPTPSASACAERCQIGTAAATWKVAWLVAIL